jgi:adenine-specific DNA-methyltransferase
MPYNNRKQQTANTFLLNDSKPKLKGNPTTSLSNNSIQETQETLVSLLLDNPQYIAKNENDIVLNKTKIADLAKNYDTELLTLLHNNKKLKTHFFISLSDGVVVFKLENFLTFINNREFLPDSYTAYKNRIGLGFAADASLLCVNRDVVLNWAGKDCVLEGGQTKDEQKRNEILYNEVLAKDQINRLLDDKVFTNFSRYDKNGKGEVSELKPTDNLIIKGNNLIVLHSLKKRYAGKVKLIYIDPPYNTGNDGFKYNDSFNHSTWLTFMKNRLEIGKRLLAEDGMIFVQCDDNEQAYLKVLMDEVFGKENFKESIVIKTSTASGVNAINVQRGERLFKLKEYLLFYTKNASTRFNTIYIKSEFNKNYHYEVNCKNGKYEIIDLTKKLDAPKLEKHCLANYENIYSLEKNNKKAGKKLKIALEESKVSNNKNKVTEEPNSKKLIYNGGVLTPLKDRIIIEEGGNSFGVLISDLWDDQVFQASANEGGITFNSGKKTEKLIKRVIEMATQKGDIVLDFFAGSATTGSVCQKMNRQWICIEQMDYIENITVERMKKVIEGEQGGISKSQEWKGGGEFVYCELANNSQAFRDEVASAKASDFPKLLEKIKNSSYLSHKIDRKAMDGFENLSEDDQRKLLYELVDANTLYINYSDIESKDYKILEQDKKLNKQFYGGN